MHPRGLLAAVLVLAGVFTVGLALGHATAPVRLTGWLTGDRGEQLPPSTPTTLAIPSLSLQAAVLPVGLDHNGAIEAPPMARSHEAGWYADGPTPGQYGAAVIVGHVDDAYGPAVFYHLDRLRPGDRIEITRRDGEVTNFEVTGIRTYDKLALPIDEVYGDADRPELRLITCGGRWVGGETGYADNVVVFATLVSP